MSTVRFKEMFRKLRVNLVDETNCLYVLHTPHGNINVGLFNHSVPGFVIVIGEDEAKKDRVLVFSDEAICSFSLEVLPKKSSNPKKAVGFKPERSTAKP